MQSNNTEQNNGAASALHVQDFQDVPAPVIADGQLEWRSVVRGDGTERTHLVLSSQNGYFDGFGRQISCSVLLPNVDARRNVTVYHRSLRERENPIELRIVSKEPVTYRAGGGIDRPEGPDYRYISAEEEIPIRVVDDRRHEYYLVGTVQGGIAVPLRAVRERVIVQEADGSAVESIALHITLPNGRRYSLEIDENQNDAGKLLQRAIYGEVRRLYRCLPIEGSEQLSLTTQRVAVKVVKRSMLPGGAEFRQDRSENPLKEISLLQHVHQVAELRGTAGGSPYVVRPIDCLADANNLYQLLEYFEDGDMLDHLPRCGFDEGRARSFFLHVVRGQIALKEAGVANLDLSLENILVTNFNTDEERAALTDLGMAESVAVDPVTGQTVHVPFYGRRGKKYYYPPEYFPPNAVTAGPVDPHAVDAWALGVTLLLLLTGQEPFDHNGQYGPRMIQWFTMISQGEARIGEFLVQNPNYDNQFPLRTEVFTRQDGSQVQRVIPALIPLRERVSPGAFHLLSNLLQIQPGDRLTLTDLTNHPWLQ